MKFRYATGIVLGAAALAALVWGSGLAAARFFPGKYRLPPRAELTGGSIQPGDAVEASAVVELPADLRPEAPVLRGEGIVPLPGSAECVAWRWNRRRWRLVGKFRVLTAGKHDGLNMTFDVRPEIFRRPTDAVRLSVPEFTAELDGKLAPDAELVLSDEIAPPRPETRNRRRWYWAAALAALVLAGVIAWLFFRRVRPSVSAPIWVMALDAVERLRTALERGELTPEQGFSRLCEVVREYLEIRFGLPASRRTTQEFMRELASDPLDLPDAQRDFLHRFLHAADMVKFARAATEPSAFESAANRAEELVRATTPEGSR